MIRNHPTDTAHDTVTRLLVGNLPYEMDKSEFAAAFTPHADLTDVYLSAAKAPNRNNAGWGIIAVRETAARHILDQTIRVGDRVARINRARAQTQ